MYVCDTYMCVYIHTYVWVYIYIAICVWLISLCMFSGFIGVVVCISTSFLYCQVIFLCMDIPHCFVIHDWWTLDCFYFLAIANNAAINIWVQVFVWKYALNSLGIYPGVVLLNYMVTLCLTFSEITKWFSKVAAPSYILPTTYKGSNFKSWPTLVIVCLFYYSHLGVCEVFWFGFSWRCWATLHVFIGHLHIFFGGMFI